MLSDHLDLGHRLHRVAGTGSNYLYIKCVYVLFYYHIDYNLLKQAIADGKWVVDKKAASIMHGVLSGGTTALAHNFK